MAPLNGKTITVSLDVMGGDHGPGVVLAGAEIARRRYGDLRYILHGEEAAVAPILASMQELKAVSEFIACETSIAMDDKPSQALRHGRRGSGMWRAL